MGMMTMQKTAGGIQVIPLETMLLEEGKIYIRGVRSVCPADYVP